MFIHFLTLDFKAKIKIQSCTLIGKKQLKSFNHISPQNRFIYSMCGT